MTVQAILFDLDGTLLDSINDIANCANAVLAKFQHPTHLVARYKELVGDGLGNLAKKVLPASHNSDEEVSRFVTEYRTLYQHKWNETSTIYPGISSLLQELTARKVLLAVLSNKRHDFTQACVSHFFPEVPFKEVRGEQAGTPIKPYPDSAIDIAMALNVAPETCLFVGDSEIDIETGIRAGMTSIGVLWGFRPRHVLESAGASRIISAPAELMTIIDRSA